MDDLTVICLIQFSDTANFIDDCSNGTLVQANADNKKVNHIIGLFKNPIPNISFLYSIYHFSLYSITYDSV